MSPFVSMHFTKLSEAYSHTVPSVLTILFQAKKVTLQKLVSLIWITDSFLRQFVT